MKDDLLKPSFRYGLKGAIHKAEYRTLTAYAAAVGTGISKMSRIVTGWEIPSLNLSKKMAKKLGLTIKEFGELL